MAGPVYRAQQVIGLSRFTLKASQNWYYQVFDFGLTSILPVLYRSVQVNHWDFFPPKGTAKGYQKEARLS